MKKNNEKFELEYRSVKLDTNRLLSPVSMVNTENVSLDVKEVRKTNLLKYLNPVLTQYLENTSLRSRSQSQFWGSKRVSGNAQKSSRSKGSSNDRFTYGKNNIREQLKRYESIQNDDLFARASDFETPNVKKIKMGEESETAKHDYTSDEDTENPRTTPKSILKAKLSINDIQIMVRKTFAKFILNGKNPNRSYDQIFKGPVLQPEFILRFKDNIQFEKFYNGVIQIFGNNLRFEIDERYFMLLNNIGTCISSGDGNFPKLVNEWLGLGLTIAKVQAIEVLSSLIFKIITIKAQCRKKQELISHYQEDLKGFNKHTKAHKNYLKSIAKFEKDKWTLAKKFFFYTLEFKHAFGYKVADFFIDFFEASKEKITTRVIFSHMKKEFFDRKNLKIFLRKRKERKLLDCFYEWKKRAEDRFFHRRRKRRADFFFKKKYFYLIIKGFYFKKKQEIDEKNSREFRAMKLIQKSLHVLKGYRNHCRGEEDDFDPNQSGFLTKNAQEFLSGNLRNSVLGIIENNLQPFILQGRLTEDVIRHSFALTRFEKLFLHTSQKIQILFEMKKTMVTKYKILTAMKENTISSKFRRQRAKKKIFFFLKNSQKKFSQERNQKLSAFTLYRNIKTISKCFSYLKKKILLSNLLVNYKNFKKVKNYKKGLKIKYNFFKKWLKAKKRKQHGTKKKTAVAFHNSIILLKALFGLKNYKKMKQRRLEKLALIEKKLFIRQKRKIFETLRWKKWHSLFIILNKRRFVMKESVFNILNYNRSMNKIVKYFSLKKIFFSWKQVAMSSQRMSPLHYYCGNLKLKGFLSLKVTLMDRRKARIDLGNVLGFRRYKNRMLMRKIFGFFCERLERKRRLKFRVLEVKGKNRRRVMTNFLYLWRMRLQDKLRDDDLEETLIMYMKQRKKKILLHHWYIVIGDAKRDNLRVRTPNLIKKIELFREKREARVKRNIILALLDYSRNKPTVTNHAKAISVGQNQTKNSDHLSKSVIQRIKTLSLQS